MQRRIYQIISQLFGIPEDQIKDTTAPGDVPNWDSLGHLNLILALEREFDVSFTAEEVTQLLSVGSIKTKISTLSNAVE